MWKSEPPVWRGASGRSWGWRLHQWNWCPCYRALQGLPCCFLHRRTERKDWQSMDQKVGSHQILNLLEPWPWASQPPKFREINLYCLCHLVPGIFVIAARAKTSTQKGGWEKTNVWRQVIKMVRRLENHVLQGCSTREKENTSRHERSPGMTRCHMVYRTSPVCLQKVNSAIKPEASCPKMTWGWPKVWVHQCIRIQMEDGCHSKGIM